MITPSVLQRIAMACPAFRWEVNGIAHVAATGVRVQVHLAVDRQVLVSWATGQGQDASVQSAWVPASALVPDLMAMRGQMLDWIRQATGDPGVHVVHSPHGRAGWAVLPSKGQDALSRNETEIGALVHALVRCK